jgi:molecular chaperone DnaK
VAVDNRKLRTFSLTNIPPGPAGEQEIEVTFDISDEGILHVSTKIMSSGEEESIQIHVRK